MNQPLKPTVLMRNLDGEPMLSADAMALLFGVPAEEIVAYSSNPGTAFPAAWIRAGRRRAREAAAATGKDDLFSVLAFWAKKDRDMVITVEENDL